MKKLLLTSMFLLSTVSTVVSANDGKQDAAMELFNVMGYEKQVMGGFDAMLPMIDGLAQRMQLDAAAKAELIQIYRDWFEHDIDHDKMRHALAGIYAKQFTVSEIKELIAFFKSPLGMKLSDTMPEIAKLSAEIGMQSAQQSEQLLMQRLEPFMKKHAPQY